MSSVIFNDLQALPEWQSIDIALLTVGWQASAEDAFRRAFYNLRQSNKTYRIADLGCLRAGVDAVETCLRLQDVCAFLLQKQVTPCIVADRHELDIGQFRAYQQTGQLIYVLQVDQTLDLKIQGDALQHLDEMITWQPNFLLGAGLLAYQQHLTDSAHLELWQQLGFDLMSLGKMRDDMKAAEPLIRSAHMISFDVAALRPFFTPPHQPFPFGLHPEEACQIAWYAGNSEHLSSLGLYGYHPEKDPHGLMAALLATMVWYFIEGYDKSNKSLNFSDSRFVKYVVPIGTSYQLVFYKHVHNEKWWMELPADESALLNSGKPRAIPCSYADYLTACSGVPPDCWVRLSARLG
ncbi:MAG: arginase family protein [Bernardetiaceae bacterium]|nr:arginase family protein [Bernardetiaceae bacterium]